MDTSPAIAITGLGVRRGTRDVLRDFSLTIQAGSITALIGPSGCGKSTLMRAIMGIQIVQAGQVLVLGLPAGSPELRRRIGYAPQAASVYRDLPVRENLRYFAALLDASPGDVDRVLQEVDLEGQRDQQVGRLSGGQITRVSLAVALLGEPRVLVLDEPTVGLDPVLREDLWALFRRLASERGVTLLVSSHVMDEAARCDDLVLMREGKILAHDRPDAICARTGTTSLDAAFLRLVQDTARAEAAL